MTARSITLSLIGLVLSLTLVACSPDAKSYENVAGLANAVSDAGVDCRRLEASPKAELVKEGGRCADSGVALFLFEGSDDLDDWKKVATRLGPVVIGPNWAITGDHEDLARIADRLGGDIVSSDG